MAEEPEREPRRKLKTRDEYVPALAKQLFDGLLSGGAMWNVREVAQGAFQKATSPGCLARLSIGWSARFSFLIVTRTSVGSPAKM